jgi:hypothetical protein
MEQEQDEKNDEYQPDKSRRNVTPTAAMRPARDAPMRIRMRMIRRIVVSIYAAPLC